MARGNAHRRGRAVPRGYRTFARNFHRVRAIITYLSARLRSFQYAFRGINDLLRRQPNAQLHLVALLLLLGLGYYFQLSRWEWSILLLCAAAVLVTEALNTALEYLVDLVSPGYHPLAGRAKDAAAAAVLLMALGAATIGLIIFWPYLENILLFFNFTLPNYTSRIIL